MEPGRPDPASPRCRHGHSVVTSLTGDQAMRTIRPFLALVVVLVALAACAGSAAQLAPVGQPADEFGYSTRRAPARSRPPVPPRERPRAKTIRAATPIGARDDAKIIRTGTIELEVKDVPTALRTARDAIVGLGGYVGASNTSNFDDKPSRPDHVPDPGRSLGGRARHPAHPQRPDEARSSPSRPRRST